MLVSHCGVLLIMLLCEFLTCHPSTMMGKRREVQCNADDQSSGDKRPGVRHSSAGQVQ